MTSTITLFSLPTEVQQQILTYLPLSTLLTFARTNKENYGLATASINNLHLAVFPRRIHGILSFLNSSPSSFFEEGSCSAHQVAVVASGKPRLGGNATSLEKTVPISWIQQSALIPPNSRTSTATNSRNSSPSPNSSRPRLRRNPSSDSNTSPALHRTRNINHQNEILSTLLDTPILDSLSNLTIHTTALLSPLLSSTIATSLPKLHHLTLNFSHPYVHEPCLPACYWTRTPSIAGGEGTTAWNALAGIGTEHDRKLRLRGLQSLEIRRAAMTGAQIREWVRRNRDLRKLTLGMIAGVDGEFVAALQQIMTCSSDEKRVLRTLELENCDNLTLKQPAEFEWIDRLVSAGGLRELSLRGCENVDSEMLRRLSLEQKWRERGLDVLKCPDDKEDEEEAKSCLDESLGSGNQKKGKLEVDPRFL